jgi:hypothetical protein
MTHDPSHITQSLPLALIEIGNPWIDGDEAEFPESRDGGARESAGYIDDVRLIHAVSFAGSGNPGLLVG